MTERISDIADNDTVRNYSFNTQNIGLDSIINARELGGYKLPDGSTIKHGLLLRGGALAKASEQDISKLSEQYHLACVFDFRTSIEVSHAPDKPVIGARHIWLPAFDEESMTMQKMSLPEEAYRDLSNWVQLHAAEPFVQQTAKNMYPVMFNTEFTQIQYAGFFQNILGIEDGAIYWHCSQGKDRTGFGSALILAALGADMELIMNDFEISNEFYQEEVDAACSKVKTEEEREAIRTFVGVNGKYFKNALIQLEKDYGSLMNFIKGPICLGDEDIDILRQRYLE